MQRRRRAGGPLLLRLATLATLYVLPLPSTLCTSLRSLKQAAPEAPPPQPSSAPAQPSPLSRVFDAPVAAADAASFDFWPGYTTVASGKPGTLSFNIQLVNSAGRNLSAWHDVPLGLDPVAGANDAAAANASSTVWMVALIPRDERAKYEVKEQIPWNPIQEDVNIKNASGVVTQAPRYYAFAPPGNYGIVPQTWENGSQSDAAMGLLGDDEPLDVLDIGEARAPIGGVYRVKVLGVVPLIDRNETDYKVLVINTRDPRAAQLDDISQVPQATLKTIYTFYRDYKGAEGRPSASFYQGPILGPDGRPSTRPNGRFLGRNFTLGVLGRSHAAWQGLVAGGCVTPGCAAIWWPGKAA